MATSSFIGGAHTPRQPSGTDLASLGPSDLSDSGSDTGMGAYDPQTLEGDSDATGTGERGAAQGPSPPPGADILPDHLEDPPPGDQAELDFDELAEQAEDAALGELPLPDDPWLDDTPADVAGLSQDEASEEGDEAERGDTRSSPGARR